MVRVIAAFFWGDPSGAAGQLRLMMIPATHCGRHGPFGPGRLRRNGWGARNGWSGPWKRDRMGPHAGGRRNWGPPQPWLCARWSRRCWALIVGIWVGERLPPRGLPGPGGRWRQLLLARFLARSADIPTPWWCPFFFAALGYLLIHPWVAPELPPHHVSNFSGPVKWRITGIVEAAPATSGYRMKFVLRGETLSDGAGSTAVTGKIQVTVAGAAPGLAVGDRVMLPSRLSAFRNFNNPGGFDYRRYMAFKGVRVRAFCPGGELTVLGRVPLSGFQKRLNRYRDAVAALIDGQGRPRAQAVLKALVIGRRDGIAPGLRDAFNRAGIGHLLAISGLHIGIVAMGFFRSFSWLLARFEVLLWHAWTRKRGGPVVPGRGHGATAPAGGDVALHPAGRSHGGGFSLRVRNGTRAGVVQHPCSGRPDYFTSASASPFCGFVSALSFGAVFWILFGLRRFSAPSGAPTAAGIGFVWSAGLRRVGMFFLGFAAGVSRLPAAGDGLLQPNIAGGAGGQLPFRAADRVRGGATSGWWGRVCWLSARFWPSRLFESLSPFWTGG